MAKLSVNLNKVASLRNLRTVGIPSVEHAAKLCLEAGAHGITVHPRPDERHIRAADVGAIARVLKAYKSAEYNIEGNPFHKYMEFAEEFRPTQCTLVPDEPGQNTSDHGWNLARDGARLAPVVQRIKSLGCRVSIFMDPEPAVMELAKKLGVDRVELYTAPYAEEFEKSGARAAEPYAAAAGQAIKLGLGINAGHDLNLANLPPFISAVRGVLEVSIGHALIGDALEFGLAETVRKYLAAAGY
jgi:pyridoxine 5-phosphate synthase